MERPLGWDAKTETPDGTDSKTCETSPESTHVREECLNRYESGEPVCLNTMDGAVISVTFNAHRHRELSCG